MSIPSRATATGRRVFWTLVLLCSVSASIAYIRLRALDFDLRFMIPERVYDVDVVQVVDGHGERVRLATFLPMSDDRQRVLEEHNRSDQFELRTQVDRSGRKAEWWADDVEGKRIVNYTYRVVGQAVRYEISDEFHLGSPPADLAAYLKPTKVVQADAPEIKALAHSLRSPDGRLGSYLRAAFDHVQSFGFKPFKGTTDALTTLRLGEASCNGRSRLLVALMRAENIPARLVGGLVLTSGEKKTSHQWVEGFIGGHWVPFDPTNHHFAELPANYLALYRGDHSLFKHTSDVGFRYTFSIDPRLVPRHELEQHRAVLGLWSVFAELGIPLELLKIIIMIPLGALVVVIFRNVLGLRTFGTFLPVLIAAAAHNTGYVWGSIGFVVIILLVSSLRRVLQHLELLHSPQLAVMLTTVVGSLLLLTLLGVRWNLRALAHVSLFPIAILAITSERFVLVQLEEGSSEAWGTMFRTLIVIFFCYVAMNSLSLQILMLGFPELLLVIIAIDLWLGRWMGLRLTEWLRFHPLLLGRKEAA